MNNNNLFSPPGGDMEYSDFLRIIYPELFVSDDSCAKKQVKTVTL